MDEKNFYRAPQAALIGGPSSSAEGGITPNMLETLKKTRPWVLFIAILGMVGTGLLLVVGIGSAVMLAISDQGSVAVLGLAYLVMAVIYFFPCLYLWRYADALKRVAQGGGARALEGAFDRQYSFWRLMGVISLAVVAIYVVILVGVVIVGIIAAASGA